MKLFGHRGKKENQAIHAKLNGSSHSIDNTRKKILDGMGKEKAIVGALAEEVKLEDPKRHEDYYHFAEGHEYSKRPEIKKEKKY